MPWRYFGFVRKVSVIVNGRPSWLASQTVTPECGYGPAKPAILILTSMPTAVMATLPLRVVLKNGAAPEITMRPGTLWRLSGDTTALGMRVRRDYATSPT